MPWQWTQYAVPYLVATAISFALACYGIYRLGDDRSALVAGFVVTMVGSTLWTGLELLRISATTLDAKLLFEVLNVGKDVTILGFLLFALAYTNHDEWLRPRRVALLAAWPVAYYLFLQPTWQYHDLTIVDPAVWPTKGVRRLGVEQGFAMGVVDPIWAYLAVLTGIAVVARMAYQERGVYRRQALLIVAGALVPTLLNVPMMTAGTGLLPFEWPYYFDVSAVAMSVTGVALAVAISRYRFLDLVPVGRDTVIETMRDGYVVLDENGRVVDLNPAARRILDLDGDPIGTGADEVLPGVDLVDRHQRGDRVQGEVEIGDGDRRQYVEVDASPLSAGDRFVGRLVTLRDVTDRRSVEKRYQSLIEHSSDLITVLDESGRIQYQSPSVGRVLGYSQDDLLGENVFEYVHPEDRESVTEAFANTVAERGNQARVEFRIRDADGDYRVLEALGQNLLANPDVEGIVVNSRDVTRRKERERELHRKNERLDEFASVVSHDLRNPLSVAQGRVDLARTQNDPGTHLPPVEDSLDRMEDIIDDVLTLARQGEDVVEPRSVDLESRAREAWSNVDTGDATLRVEGTRDLSADPDRLLQLFENLFRNAVEHGSTGSRPQVDAVTVTVGPTWAGDGFFVADDGPGIPEDHREDVFESGYTTAREGTGFGLAIVERVADAHDWSVEVGESASGGARFDVTGLAPVATTDATDD